MNTRWFVPCATLLTALLLAPLATPGADESLQREGKTDGIAALGTDFPKAVHYRYANNFKVKPGQEDAAYREWLANYGRVMGVVQHKIFNYTLSRDGTPQILAGQELPFHLSRAVLGLATIHKAAVTWYSQPPAEPDGHAGVYDEIRMGAAHRLGWLGKPRCDLVYLGRAEPDLCAGRLALPQTATGGKDGNRNASLGLSVTPMAPELLVVARWRGEPRAGVGLNMPRNVVVSLRGAAVGEGSLLPADAASLEAGLRFTDGTVQMLPNREGNT